MVRQIRIAALAALLAALAGPALGAGALDRRYGTPELGLSARSRAMGGAGAALPGGAFGLVDNPATLALRRGSRIDLTGGISRASENRLVPLFDTFDSYVDDAAIAINDHVYGSLSGGVVWDPGFPSGPMHGFVFAAGVFDRYDPRYDYQDERRTTATTDEIVAERFIRTRGTLRAWSFGAAVPIRERATIGAAVQWYEGVWTDRDALVPRTPAVSGRTSEAERRLAGHSLTLGGTFDVDAHLRAALAFETRPDLRDEFTQWEDDSLVTPAGARADLRLPWRLHAGAAYRPRNTLRTTFVLDVVYTPWTEVEDPLDTGPTLLDTWDARFGLEHEVLEGLPGRVGFRYARSYTTREADRVTFTFGIGYALERVAIDLAGEVGKATSRQEPLWPRDEQGPAVGAGRDRVEDTLVRAYLGVRVTP
jgi:hypothetical protein